MTDCFQNFSIGNHGFSSIKCGDIYPQNISMESEYALGMSAVMTDNFALSVNETNAWMWQN